MKRYTYLFDYEINKQKLRGTIDLVAGDMIEANRMFDNLYVRGYDSGCSKNTFGTTPFCNGIKMQVINISESELN